MVVMEVNEVKIQLLSDLHLEANPSWTFRPADGAEVLVLAGDIGSYQIGPHGKVMQEPDWGLRRFSPLPQHGGWPVPVVFVPGNHEYDGLDFDVAHQALRDTCERLGIVWLERASWVFKRVRFLGTTLWSDFDALADPGESLSQSMRRREKAYRAANFYLRKTATQRKGQPFDAEAVRAQSLSCQAWLSEQLSHPHEGPTVVVTHFAPSLRSADLRYGLTPGTAGFCNALDVHLASADLWLHGHLHCRHDYRVGRCRVVSNPLGYAHKGEQDTFTAQNAVVLDT